MRFKRFLILGLLLLAGCAGIKHNKNAQNSVTPQKGEARDQAFLEVLAMNGAPRGEDMAVASEPVSDDEEILEEITDDPKKPVGKRFNSFAYTPFRRFTPSPEIEKEILAEDLDKSVSKKLFEKDGRHVVPNEINEAVQKWIDILTDKEEALFARYLKRSGRYEKSVKEILREEGVPEDLFYLMMIESGFTTKARSRAGATGPWQFMHGTAKNYKLRMTRYLDERRDPWKSTTAAARYLRGLYKAFGSWYLAMASYNAGEMRTLGAILRADSRDFWELAAQNRLPKETMNYIPKFIAAMIIAKHPDKYGFDPAEIDPPLDSELVNVPGGRRLRDIARAIGVSHEDLELLNPAIIRGITPPNEEYEIRVPKGSSDLLVARVGSLPKVAEPKEQRVFNSGNTHKVRMGESLWLIAKKYGVSVKELAQLNRLPYPYKIYPNQRIQIPG